MKRKDQFDDYEHDEILHAILAYRRDPRTAMHLIQKTMRPKPQSRKSATIDQSLLRPHYSNELFREQQHVFVAAGYKVDLDDKNGTIDAESIEYNYSDRIWQWYGNARECSEKAREQFPNLYSAEHYEAYLRLVMKKPHLELVHIIAGINHSNGYDYHVYGYFPDGIPT